MNAGIGGMGGATSLKEEMVERFPDLKTAADYRYARYVLQQYLGGAMAVGQELTSGGFVEALTNMLKTDLPSQVFAKIAVGKITQPNMQAEQNALGDYKEKFHVCSNRVENDLHWDSPDPKWVKKSSMAVRHRFLTTKNLHWQWFNALVFGLVPPEAGGVSCQEAIAEVETMKAAALHYAKHVGGWSDQIGLFVNVFGHNNMNCLFVHILDMSQVGPSFQFFEYKNLDLEVVLQVLREEATTDKKLCTPLDAGGKPTAKNRRTLVADEKARKYISGAGGATSLKAEIVATVPELNTASQYRSARRMLIDKLGGVQALFHEVKSAGYVDDNGQLTTGTKPFNLFARCASGNMKQDGMAYEQEALGSSKDRWMVCKNRPENDEHWDSEEPEWVGKASMSRRHRFLTVKDLHWQWFNALTFGLLPTDMGGVSYDDAIDKIEEMKAAAKTYVANIGGWSDNVGLFFHVFGHNSVNSLHLHILDLNDVGPTFHKYEYKNCPLEVVLKVLAEEARASVDLISRLKNESSVAFTIVEPALRRSQATEKQKRENDAIEKWRNQILEINVAGTIIFIQRRTLLMAPLGSRLRSMFDESEAEHFLDDTERIFLDLPPDSVQIIFNRLRILRFDPDAVSKVKSSHRPSNELHQVVHFLGVNELFPELRTSWIGWSCFAWCQ
jgi:hypothetical protein